MFALRQTLGSNGTVIRYAYDAAGNRILKEVNGQQTWYVRDAQGNTLSVYRYGDNSLNSGALTQAESHLYGSSRLGITTPGVNVQTIAAPTLTTLPGLGVGINLSFTRGKKFFELSNHLGNVLATVSDKKLGVDSNGDGVIDHYAPDVESAQDYYSFGMMMPGRQFTAGSGYRYGFNGKENDNEVKGEGGQQDYGMRVYDPRLGKFLSVDPLTKSFPWYSPYHFAGNNPIQNTDLDGGEPQDYRKNWQYQKIIPRSGGESEWDAYSSKTALGWIYYQAVYDKVTNQYWFVHQGNDGIDYYWKHNPGANQMEYISTPGKANGVWTQFETADAFDARVRAKTADFLTALTVGPLVALPGSVAVAAAAPTIASLIPQASTGERFGSLLVDYGSQIAGNYAAGGEGFDALTDVNANALFLSFANPGTTWKQLAFNNTIGSAFSISTIKGYDGIGGGKEIVTAGLEATVGTLAGRATRGIDLKAKSLQARLDHVNGLLGRSSPLSTSLRSALKTNQAVGVGIGLPTGGAANGLNKTMDTKE